MAESGGLLNRCTSKIVPGVRIPLSPPFPGFRYLLSLLKALIFIESLVIKSRMTSVTSLSHRVMPLPWNWLLLFAAFAVSAPLTVHAQTNQSKPTTNDVNEAYLREHYTKFEYKIPMRDGVKLLTAVYAPKNDSRPHPIRDFQVIGGRVKINLGFIRGAHSGFHGREE